MMRRWWLAGGVTLAALVACGGKAVIDHLGTGGGAGTPTSSATGGGASTTSSSATGGSGASPIDCDSCSALAGDGKLEFGEINEASGLAASQLHQNVFYTHNDSGDSERFFALTSVGLHMGSFTLEGSGAQDWEDIAVGPCPKGIGEGSCIFIGDIGDNDEVRSSYQLYVVPEPTSVGIGDQTLSAVVLDFVYPDGSHNAEALLVHPQSGEIAIITKTANGPSQIFSFPQNLTVGGVNTLNQTGEVSTPLGLPLITAADVHPKGRGVLLRSYTNVFYYPPAPTIAAMFASDDFCVMQAAPEGQGEAIAWTATGDGFLTVSEGVGSTVHRYGCGSQ